MKKSATRFRLLVVLVVAVVMASSANHTAITTDDGPDSKGAMALQGNSSTARLEAERITIRPTGFEPAEITRPAGRFLLAVNDRSGARDLVLTLARVNGQRLHTARMRDNPRKHEWRQLVNLPPGRYVVSEANHSEWICRITLTGN